MREVKTGELQNVKMRGWDFEDIQVRRTARLSKLQMGRWVCCERAGVNAGQSAENVALDEDGDWIGQE